MRTQAALPAAIRDTRSAMVPRIVPLAVGVLALLAGCGSKDLAPAASPDIEAGAPEATPWTLPGASELEPAPAWNSTGQRSGDRAMLCVKTNEVARADGLALSGVDLPAGRQESMGPSARGTGG